MIPVKMDGALHTSRVLNIRLKSSQINSNYKQKLAAQLIMEAVGQRIKSAYDIYIPMGSNIIPTAETCFNGVWKRIDMFTTNGKLSPAYFCFPKDGNICVENPFSMNDKKACFTVEAFSGATASDSEVSLNFNPSIQLKPIEDVARIWNIDEYQARFNSILVSKIQLSISES